MLTNIPIINGVNTGLPDFLDNVREKIADITDQHTFPAGLTSLEIKPVVDGTRILAIAEEKQNGTDSILTHRLEMGKFYPPFTGENAHELNLTALAAAATVLKSNCVIIITNMGEFAKIDCTQEGVL